MQWRDIAKYGSGGLVSSIVLIVLLLNLSGMSYTIPEDIFCEDCYSPIDTNSTYWEIKVEHAGMEEVIFKKTARNRTLWVNLDKITELVQTEPNIKTEILVPTISRYATQKHEEYGFLRPLKDGDTLIARGQDRFIVQGVKPFDLTVKWSFKLEDYTIEDINIDPIWFGINVSYIETCQTELVDNWTQKIIYYNVSCNPLNLTCTKPITYKNYTMENKPYNRKTCKDIGLRVGNRNINFNKQNVYCRYKYSAPIVTILCLDCNKGDCRALAEGRITSKPKGQEGCIFRFNAEDKECQSTCDLTYREKVSKCEELT